MQYFDYKDVLCLTYDKTFCFLIYKHLEMHWCIFSTAVTDALVLKHQAISTPSTYWIFFVLDQWSSYQNVIFRGQQHNKMKSHFGQKKTQSFEG